MWNIRDISTYQILQPVLFLLLGNERVYQLIHIAHIRHLTETETTVQSDATPVNN